MQPTNADNPLQTTDHTPAREAAPASEIKAAPAAITGQIPVTCPPNRTPEAGLGFSPVPSEPPLPSIPGNTLEGVLGRGGMGVIYKAQHLALKRTVALKMVLAGGHAGPKEFARFRIEAEAVARLQHPHIVQIHEIGEANGHPYCALEFVEGGNLADKLNGKPMPAREAARLVEALARAMQLAHGRSVVHRDLKPANILLTAEGTPKITDFGLARHLDSDSNETQAGTVLGTPSYMAPEQASGRAHLAGPAADIYALGAILYDCLTARPPFKGKSIIETLDLVRTEQPAPPSRWQAGVPLDLDTICLKCLRKEPENRYASAAELADELLRYQKGEPILARPVGRGERALKWVRRNPVVAGAAVAVVLALAVGTAVSYLKYLDAEQQKGIALQQQVRAEAGETAATEQRYRADQEAEVTRQHLYYAQMHLAQQAWREHRGLPHMRQLLANWLPGDKAPDRRGWEWFYLNSLPYQNQRTLAGGGGDQKCQIVAWHVPSKRLAESIADGLIRIWDVDREQPTWVLKGPAPVAAWWGVRRLGWSPDGGKLAAGGKNGSVHIWDTDTGRELQVLRGHSSPVWSVAYSSDGARLAAWGHDGTIQIWDANTSRLTTTVAHPGAVSAGAWSPDDALLATGHDDGTVTLSGTQAGARIDTLRGHVNRIFDLAWSPDRTRLASTSVDFTARIWEVASGKMVLGPLRHSHGITAVAWQPNGQTLATGSIDQAIKIWDATTGHETLTLRGYLQPVTSVTWGPGGRLASGSQDGTLKIWDSIHDQESSGLPGHLVRVTAVAWCPDGKRLASGGDDGRVRIWNPATRAEIRSLKGHDERQILPQFGLIRTVAWSPEGTHLASGSLDGTTKVWEAASGREVFALPAEHGPVWSVAWNPDGTRLAVGSRDGTIRVVEGRRPTPNVQVFQAHERPRAGWPGVAGVRALAWSPQGDRLASAGSDLRLKLWDPIRGAELARLEGPQRAITGVAWSPDGRRLASASRDYLVRVWDAESGRNLVTMRGHNDWVDAVVWSPDGTRLASAGLDNSVRIWDVRTGEEAFALHGSAGMFHDVSWNPDGAQLAAASSDGQVWVWDATRGFERDTTPRALPFIERKIASGTARNEERLAFAQTAFDHKQFAFAARLWAAALASDPKRGDDRQTLHRFHAARAASLAADGQGLDESPLDDAAKAKLRGQALAWLKAELTVWSQWLDDDPPQARPALGETLRHWQKNTDLASIRDKEALAKLPAEDQQSLTQLWADVAALLKKAEEKPN